MSDERLDYDMSDVSTTDTSWADAQADTPTMGKNCSDSEDTLSNLSFDNELVEGANGAAGGGLEHSTNQPSSPKESANHVHFSGAGIGEERLPEFLISLPKESGASSKIPLVNHHKTSDKSDDDDRSSAQDNSTNTSSSGIRVQVCITTAEISAPEAGKPPGEFQLNLPPGVSYQAPSVDFPSSPSQIKFSQGESFLPKEEAGVISEDDTSFASSCRAHLDLNLLNGGVGVHLKKKFIKIEELEEIIPNSVPKMSSVPDFKITSCENDNGNNNASKSAINPSTNNHQFLHEPESLASLATMGNESGNEELDDYMEDFYLPISNESVMSRQTSFRRKVQKELDNAAAETAIHELNKFERMLSSYDEESEIELNNYHADDDDEEIPTSSTPKVRRRSSPNPPSIDSKPDKHELGDGNLRLNESGRNTRCDRGKDHINERSNLNNVKKVLNFDDEADEDPPQSILDIDKIIHTHAPELMSDSKRHSSDSEIIEYETLHNFRSTADEPVSLMTTSMNGGNELESGYFLQKTTLDKLASVYDLTNFANLYTLSGELKHILSPVEIEEIVLNRIHLENIVDPKVLAALSWSLAETALPSSNNNNKGENCATETIVGETNMKNSSAIVGTKILAHSPPPMIIVDDTDSSTKNGKISGSKNSSISAGFHSQSPSVDSLNSDSSDDAESTSPTPNERDSQPNTASVVTNSSLRRKISIEDASITSDLPTLKYVDEPITNPILKKLNSDFDTSGNSTGHNRSNSSGSNIANNSSNNTVWRSLESFDDLKLEDDLESGNESDATNGSTANNLVLVRRDSKRFKDSKRIVQGLFIESKNGSVNGTLKRIRAPLHLSEDYTPGTETGTDLSLEFKLDLDKESNEQAKHMNASKKRISVDEKILSAASELDDSSQATNADDVTQSDVFHSFMASLKDEDPTIKSELNSDDGEVDEITLDLNSSPDDMADSILGDIEQIEGIPHDEGDNYRSPNGDEESFEEMKWRSFRVGANDIQIDMKAIEPYRRVLSHGGYFDVEKNVSIILFSGCYLPDRSRREYSHLMDHLFLYVLSGLEELIAQDYIIVYLHGSTPRSCQPTFGWLKRCYQLIDHKLRKNLKALYLVHPTFWLRTVVALTKPFISSKFSQKIQIVHTLAELCLEIPTEHLVIPDKVLQYDFDLKVAQLRKQDQLT